MRVVLYVIVVSIINLGCGNKIIVQHAAQVNDLKAKFFYTLPANTLEVEIKIKKETFTRGSKFDLACPQFVEAAVQYFGMDKNTMEELTKKASYVRYSMDNESFTWSEGAVPDSNKIYVFQNRPSFLKDNSFSFAFNKDWMLSSATVSTENKTFELVTSFLSTVTGTATAMFKSSTASVRMIPVNAACNNIFAPVLKMKADFEDFQLSPPPALNSEALTLSKITRLKQIEKTLEDLFYKKKEEISTVRFSLLITPDMMAAQPIKFFKVDPSTGKVRLNSMFYSNLIWPKKGIKIEPAVISHTEAGYYNIFLEKQSNSLQSTQANKFPTATPEIRTGIVYNVPGVIRFYLISDGTDEVIATSLFSVAQLGSVNYLPIKASKADFTLDSITGSLTKISMESKSFSADRLKSGGALVQQIDSSLKKKTPMQKLQDEITELELRVKKKELESKLQ